MCKSSLERPHMNWWIVWEPLLIGVTFQQMRKGMKCPIPSSLCPHRQWAGQDIACSWTQGHNSQDAWNIQDSHSHSRQPKCYGPWIQNCQCCQKMEPMTSVLPPTTATENIKTPEPTCMQDLHKIPCTWQSLLPCQGLHMLILCQKWSLGCQMPKHLQQTEGSKQEATKTWTQWWKAKADPHCWCRQWLWSLMWWSPSWHHHNQHWCTH